MKVLFIIPKGMYSGGGKKGYSPPFPHLGIAYLTSVLQKQGISVKIVDMRIGYSYRDLSNFITVFNPEIIGINCFSYGYLTAYKIIDYCKNIYVHKKIVIGGPHVAAFGKSVLEGCNADFALKGEGELSFLELCEAIAYNGGYEKINGLIWRENHDVIENMSRTFIADLDIISFPAYEQFELEKYVSYNQKLIPIITSRSCPYECVYCSVKLSMGRGFRARSPENVVAEIEYWFGKGWKSFDINDDCFSLDINRAINICDLILKKNLKIEYKLYNGIRADRFSLELAQKMKSSGCTFVAFGAESGNAEVLKNIKKNITLEKIRESVEIANKVGLANQVNFIIGHPGETYNRALDSIKFAKSLPTNFVAFYNCVPYPGTELFEWIEKHAKFRYPPEFFLNEIGYGETEPIFETYEFSSAERKKVMRMGILLNRKTLLKFKLGMIFGLFAYIFARNDKLWSYGATFFKGSKIGDVIFRLLVKRLQNINVK